MQFINCMPIYRVYMSITTDPTSLLLNKHCLFILSEFLQNIFSKHKIHKLDKEHNADAKHGCTSDLGWDDHIWVGLEQVGQGPPQPEPHTTKQNHEAPVQDNLNSTFVTAGLPEKPSTRGGAHIGGNCTCSMVMY